MEHSQTNTVDRKTEQRNEYIKKETLSKIESLAIAAKDRDWKFCALIIEELSVYIPNLETMLPEPNGNKPKEVNKKTRTLEKRIYLPPKCVEILSLMFGFSSDEDAPDKKYNPVEVIYYYHPELKNLNITDKKVVKEYVMVRGALTQGLNAIRKFFENGAEINNVSPSNQSFFEKIVSAYPNKNIDELIKGINYKKYERITDWTAPFV